MAAAGGPVKVIRPPNQTLREVLLESEKSSAENQKMQNFQIGAFLEGAPADTLTVLLSAAKILLARRRRFKLSVFFTTETNPESTHSFCEEINGLRQVIELIAMEKIDPDFPQFDICLWIGLTEEQPVCILKGMTKGIPWIATGSSEAVELLFGKAGDTYGPAGLVVPPRAADMIADYCEWFSEHPNVRQLFAESGRRRARELGGI